MPGRVICSAINYGNRIGGAFYFYSIESGPKRLSRYLYCGSDCFLADFTIGPNFVTKRGQGKSLPLGLIQGLKDL